MYFPLLVRLQQQRSRSERVLPASSLLCAPRASLSPSKPISTAVLLR